MAPGGRPSPWPPPAPPAAAALGGARGREVWETRAVWRGTRPGAAPPTTPAPAEDGAGGSAAIVGALQAAGLNADEVDYINAHGTATDLNDASETRALKSALGELAYKIPISSTKSMTGHMMGATGALEAIFCVQAIRCGAVPPTIHYQTPDPNCDLDYVPNHARELPGRGALSNSFRFGGHNSVLAFRAFSG